MASIGELFQSDRVNADQTLQALDAWGQGADINKIIEDDAAEKAANLADSFAAEAFDSPAQDVEPHHIDLLEAPEEQELLEAYNVVPSFEEPSYAEVSQSNDEGLDQYGIPLSTETVKPERTHGVAAEAGTLHVEADISPEQAEKDTVNELTSMAFDVIRQNILLANGAKFTDEQKQGYNETDSKMVDLFKVCEANNYKPEVIENLTQLLDQSLFNAPKFAMGSSETVAPIEFITPGSSEITELETTSVAVEATPGSVENVVSTEAKADDEKYPLHSRVTSVNNGVVRAGWRISAIRKDDTGRTLYDLHHNLVDEDMEGLTAQTLDAFQNLEPTAAEDNPDLKDEVRTAISDLKEKAANKFESTKTDAIEVREYVGDRAVEAGRKAQEWWDETGRERAEKVASTWKSGREWLKKKFGGAEMSEKWKGALLDPYYKLSADISTKLAVRRETYEMKYPKGSEAREKINNKRRVMLVAGAATYVAYRAFVSYNGLSSGGGGGLDYLTQNGSGSTGGGDYLGTPGGANGLLETASPAPSSHESISLDQLSNDPDVSIVEAPAPSGTHGVESVPTPDSAPTIEAAPVTVSPETVTPSVDIKSIRSGEDGLGWFKRNGLSEKDWYNHSSDMMKRFPKDLYRSGSDIRLNHTGMVSKEFQNYLVNLKK